MRNNYLLRKYGITSEQYDDLLQRQKGCCAVCGKHARSFKYRLAVDHDHNSGEIRGLLCFYCNKKIIGRHRQPNEIILKKAYQYLIRKYTGWFVPKKRKKHGSRLAQDIKRKHGL